MELTSAVGRSRSQNVQLSGGIRTTFIALWCVITLASVVSLGLSIYISNLWDRLPAADVARYIADSTAADVQAHANWQAIVLQSGLSLSAYAWIFTTARLIGSIALLLVSAALIRRYSRHLMGMLMAILLPILAAAGMWGNPLFGWDVAIAPWMKVPVQLLGWLTWCGAIVIFMFPDGKFTPRWTAILAVLLVPVTFLQAFDVDIFLNPNNWPGLFSLIPYLLVIGGILIAVLYRRAHATDARERQALLGYTVGWSLLAAAYFINLALGDLYPNFAGRALFDGTSAVWYVVLSETTWFACEAILAAGLAVSLFRHRLLELPAPQAG